MKNTHPRLASIGIVLAIAAAALAWAQDEGGEDRVTVPFSDPSRPGLVKVGLLNGGITVRAYDGRDVVVEAVARQDLDDEERRERQRDRAKDSDDEGGRTRRSSAGMRRLRNTSTGLTVEEENNVMEVGADALNRTIDIVLQVPRKCSLELSSVNGGHLQVEGVEGEIDVNNVNGGVTLNDVAGSVVAHALNGPVVVTLTRVESKKPMSFSSLNGDIDVTLPADVRANIRTKSDNGEIFSDFDVQLERKKSPAFEEKPGKKGGKYRVKVESGMSGTLNGGGPEFRFETFNGNIYIRKR